MNAYKQKKDWKAEFEKEFSGAIPLYPIWGNILDFISNLIDEIEKQAQSEMKDKLQQRIGFLRQWINEKPTDMLVENSDIEYWLNLNKI